ASANTEALHALPAFVKALFIPESPMPRAWDPADATKLLPAITFAGLGGFWTLFYSYWVRDKGVGMASYWEGLQAPSQVKPKLFRPPALCQAKTKDWPMLRAGGGICFGMSASASAEICSRRS